MTRDPGSPLLCILLALLVCTAGAAEPGASRSLDDLRRTALGPDTFAAEAAIRTMAASGDIGRTAAWAVVRQRLARARPLLQRLAESVPRDAERRRKLIAELADGRQRARELLRRLDDRDARRELFDLFRKLNAARRQLDPLLLDLGAAYDAVERRPKLLQLHRDLGGNAADAAPDDADAAALTALAEKALGMTLADARAVMEVGDGAGPADDAGRAIWFHRVCRRIDAQNAGRLDLLDPYETRLLRLVNVYRECLGLWPLELDARLVQSARRHSREMATLGYFAHESPTTGLRTHQDRMRAAGYGRPGGEIIALAGSDALWVFWMAFYSPGHHRTMVSPAHTQVGYGRWDKHWTADFGRGARLALVPDGRRALAEAAVVPVGPVLPPRVTDEDRRRINWALRGGEPTFDPLGPDGAANGRR